MMQRNMSCELIKLNFVEEKCGLAYFLFELNEMTSNNIHDAHLHENRQYCVLLPLPNGNPDTNYVKQPMTFAVVSDCYREMNASGCMTKHKFPECVYEPDEEDDYNEVAL